MQGWQLWHQLHLDASDDGPLPELAMGHSATPMLRIDRQPELAASFDFAEGRGAQALSSVGTPPCACTRYLEGSGPGGQAATQPCGTCYVGTLGAIKVPQMLLLTGHASSLHARCLLEPHSGVCSSCGGPA